MSVDIQDESEFQKVAELPNSFDEVYYESVRFEHSDEEQLKRKAAVLACKDVMAKKAMYEGGLGIKLAPVDVTVRTEAAQAMQVMQYFYGPSAVSRLSAPDQRSRQFRDAGSGPSLFSDLK